MNTYHLRLDLAKGNGSSPGNSYPTVTIRQGDKNGCQIEADLYDHNERFTTAGLTAYFLMDLPDGTHYYRKQATYSAGIVTVTIDETYAASAVGVSQNAYFEILSGSTVIASTQSFTVRVLADARDGRVVGETYDSEAAELISELSDAIDDAEEAIRNVDTAITNAQAATDAANAAAARMGYNYYLDSATDADGVQRVAIMKP